MKNILKYALLAAGAWWLLKDQLSVFGFTTAGSATPEQPADSTTAGPETHPTEMISAPKSQAELDATEYAAALATVQSFTKTGYSSQQLAQIENWFYNERDLYKARNGNLNHFTGHIVIELPKYVENVKKLVPGNEQLMAAALDPSKANITGTYKLSGHQWNWYRAQAAIAAGIFVQAVHQPDIPGLDSLMTAAEYHSLLKKEAGLSGLRWR